MGSEVMGHVKWLYLAVPGRRCIRQTSRLMTGGAMGRQTTRKYVKSPGLAIAVIIMACLRGLLKCNKTLRLHYSAGGGRQVLPEPLYPHGHSNMVLEDHPW